MPRICDKCGAEIKDSDRVITDWGVGIYKYKCPQLWLCRINSFLDYLDAEYKNGIYTEDITEITSDIRHILIGETDEN